jgi:ribonucleoside-diphosphate reductase alpha chain
VNVHLMIDVYVYAPRGTGVRERLPDRRGCTGFDIEALGLRFHATVGRFDDGRLAEIFITNHKAGSMAGILASDSAVLCSLALQHGVPVDVIRKALMRDPRGKPSGPLGVVLDQLAQEGTA